MYFAHKSSYIDSDAIVNNGVKIWHFCHVSSGAVIGENTNMGQNVYIGNNVKVGANCKIQNNVSVYTGVELEDYVFCGPSCVFTNDITPRSKHPKKSEYWQKTLVKEGASIGANATIVCGNTIGRHAMVGAGGVVTKDVPDYALVLGVPAKFAGWVCECGEILGTELKCKVCGRKYSISEEGLICILEI